jgi:hypothetical protein
MNFQDLQKTSQDLEETILQVLELQPYQNDKKSKIAKIACEISIEYSISVKDLISLSRVTSAISLLRLQFESLVRAYWVYSAASDIDINKMAADLDPIAAKSADKLPMLSEMLTKLDGKIGSATYGMLQEFKYYSWRATSSYVHCGLHAISRNEKGFPLELVTNIIKQSNGLMIMAAMLVAQIANNQYAAQHLIQSQKDFSLALSDKKYQD